MCGINGIFGLKNKEQSKKMIAVMNTSLAHRGPDDEGIFTDENICLGHRRLSIIDLSPAGHNPMFSSDKRFCIIHNGEIYNFRDIKNELMDYHFKTATDTEVILAAYSKWGKDCVQKFNGMFAFAIWDNLKKELFVARDRLGIKPLYYYRKKNLFAFSSEIRALLSSELIPKKINRNNLIDYLRHQTVHAPSTIIEDVVMLMPGHYGLISESKFEIKTYWDITESVKKKSVEKKYDEICRDVFKLLLEAVERRLIADVPFGAFLSGGIDSSAIVGLMSKVGSQKVKTFSVVFDEDTFSEAKFSQIIAKKFNAEHHEINLSPENFLSELPAALKAMDHPSGDGPNTYVVSKETKKAGITMTLSGLGGDELFCGYDIFKHTVSLEKKKWITAFPKSIRKGMAAIATAAKKTASTEKIAELLLQDDLNFENSYPLSRQVLLDSQIKKILQSPSLPDNRVRQIITQFNNCIDNKIFSKVSFGEISTYMQNVLLRDTDQMSMANALEVRVPFLDYKLVEYVMSISDKYKFPYSPKKLLVDSLGDLLPVEVISRPKMGFTFPWEYWMKNELRSFCEGKINSISKRNWFVEKEIKELWKRFLSNDKRITWSRVWHIIVLENWMQQNGIEP